MAIRLSPYVFPDSPLDAQRGAEETIPVGAEDERRYRPFEPDEGGIKVWRDEQSEAIPVGADGERQYRPLRSSIPDLPLSSPTAGAGPGSMTPDTEIVASGGRMRAYPAPGTRGVGAVLQMGGLEVVNGVVAFAEAMTGGRLGADTRHALEGQLEEVFRSMRPEVQAALSREFTDLGPEGVLQNPSSYGYQLVKQIPILASLLVPAGGGAMVGGRIAGGAAAKRGASALAQQEAKRRGVVAGATVGGPIGEGTVVGGMTAAEIMSGIEQAPDKVLMGAPLYKQLRDSGADEATAKRELMNELGRREALTVGAGSIILNVIPSHVFGRILAGRSKRPWVEAMVAQPVTEAMQEPFEGYREDIAARESYDPNRKPGENWFEQSVAGASLGLGMGGATVGAGYVGRRLLGIDVIDDADTTGQRLGDPALAEAIPTKKPEQRQQEFDFQGSRVNAQPSDLPPTTEPQPQPTDMNPPGPNQFPPAPPGEYATRGGEQRPITPEPVAEPERPFTPAYPEQEYTTRGGETRTARAQPSSGGPRAEPANVQRYRQLTTQLSEEDILNPDTGTVKKPGKVKRTEAQQALIKEHTALRKELGEDILRDTLEGLRQTDMDLPPGSETDPMRRKLMQDAEQKALPAPKPEGPSEGDVGAALHTKEMDTLRSQIALLEEQPSLNEGEKARLTALRRQLTRLSKTPEALAEQARQKAEGRRRRAEAPTAKESGPASALPGDPGTLETRGPRRNVKSRVQLKLETVDPKSMEARLSRLAQQITEGRAAGRNVDHLIQQRKGIKKQLEAMAGPPVDEAQSLRDQLAEAEARAKELESRPEPVYGKRAKKAGEVNPKAKAKLAAQRRAARATAQRLKAAVEQAEATETGRDSKTKDMFGQRTPETEGRAAWRKKATGVTEAKSLLHDAVRNSMLEMMAALDAVTSSGVYSKAVSRAMMRIRGELARRIKTAKTKDDLLRALHDLAYSQGNVPIGDSPVTVSALADRVYRNLTGEKLPPEGAFSPPDTTEQLLEVATEGKQYGGRTETVVEGTDPTEAESITAAEAEISQQELVQQAVAASEAAANDISAAALGVSEAELSELGRLDEATSDSLDMVEDIDLTPPTTDITQDAEAFAKFVASEETADPYAVSLPASEAVTPLQRLADHAAQALIDVFGTRETKRLLRQSLALFSEGGLFASQPRAREVLTRWRGNVMLYAIQEGDSDLQTATSLMSEAASPELQAAWFLRSLSILAGDAKLEVGLREMLAGRDTDMLRKLGDLSEQVRQQTAYDQLGENITNFGVLTKKSDDELMAMTHPELRKYISSRLGVPMPRKGVKEKGYGKADMVKALRTREALMRDAFEVFVQSDVRLNVTSAQWSDIIREGLGDTRITDTQLDQVLTAFREARKAEGAGDPVTVLRKVLTGQIFLTDPKAIAKRDKVLQREAQQTARANHKRVFQMMNRVSDRFNRFVRKQLAVAEKVGEHTYLPPHRMADQVAAEIETARQARIDTAKREGGARGRLTQALEREREQMQDPEYQAGLERRFGGRREQLRAIYRRHGMTVPGEPNLPSPARVEGGAELAEASAAEGVRLYGALNAGEQSLESRTEYPTTNMYLRLGDPDMAAAYVDDQIRRIRERDVARREKAQKEGEEVPPPISSGGVVTELRKILEIPAESMAENANDGRLTDAQFVNLLEGLGFPKAFPDARLGENFDRNFATRQILNSLQAFGQPIFTGGRFFSEFLRPMLSLGEPKSAVLTALGTANEHTVRAIARYLNNDNAVKGNKSALIQFIVASDRFQQVWSEGLQDRAHIAAMEAAAARQDRNWSPLAAQTIASLTETEREAEVERLNEGIAEYDRLKARYATNPAVVEEVLQQRKAMVELRNLLQLKDPVRSAKRYLQKIHNEHIRSVEARIEEAKARIGALLNELGETAQRDTDWINSVKQLRLPDLNARTLNKAALQLRQLENVLQAQRKEAVKGKAGRRITETTKELARVRKLLKAIEAVDFYRDPPLRGKRKISESRHQAAVELLRSYVGDGQALLDRAQPGTGESLNNTRTHFLQDSLADARKHLGALQVQLYAAKRDAADALANPEIMSLAEMLERVTQAEQRRKQVAEDARLGRLVEEQAQDSTGETANTLNTTERDKRVAQLRARQAQVWPRVENSLASIAEWAESAQKASRRIIGEVVAALHKNRDAKDRVTTSAMETVAPYSNETVVGSKLVQWMFEIKQRMEGRNSFALPPTIRGSVQQVLHAAAKDPRYNARIKFGGKTHKLNELTVAEINKLRDDIRDAYIKGRTPAQLKQLDTINDFLDLDASMRYAYVQAYNMVGNIHVSRRVSQSQAGLKRMRNMSEEEIAAENAKLLGTLPGAKAVVETSRAGAKPMTQQQRRAAQEQERQAEQREQEEGGAEVSGWVDQSPGAELALLDTATNAGQLLPEYTSMGQQIHRRNQLRQFAEQTVDEARAAIKEQDRANKQHMDLPLAQAGEFIAGSAFVTDALTAGRGRPMGTRAILKALIESESIDDMPAVSRFMILTAEKFGLDIPVRWVSDMQTHGKTVLGRFYFDKDNPAKGRAIMLNGAAFDAIMEKERELDPELGQWNVHGRMGHVFMHELAHAMTHMNLLTDQNLQREFGSLLGIARQVMGKDHYGLTDVFEFVAEYFSNPAFQRDLHMIRINRDGTPISLWQRITNVVRAIFMLPTQATSMFTYMMDRSSALFMSPQMVQQFAETGTPHQLSQGYLNYEIAMDAPGAAMANAAELAAEQASRWNWSLKLERGLRKAKLGFMTLDQIGESYAGLASKYTNLQNKKWAEVNRDMDSATRMMQDFAALDPDVANRLSTVMLKATNYAIHPDQPRGPNSLNAHLSNSLETARIYNELKAEFDALPDDAKAVYQQVKQRHAEDYAKTTQFVTNNIMAAFNFDVNNLPANWYEQLQATENADARHKYLADLWEKHGLPDENTGKKSEKAFTEAEADALARLARRPKLMHGPYFPMKRFGKYVVRARAKMNFTFANEAEMGKVLGAIKDREPGARFEGFEGESLSGTVSFQLTEMYDQPGQAHKRHAELFNEAVMDMRGEAFEFKGQKLTWSEVPGVAEKNQLQMHELAGHYSSSFMTRMQDKLKKQPAALAAAKEAYLQMLPDTSMRKLELKRGHVQGASNDMIRSFAAVTKSAAYGNAQIKYGRLLSNEMQDMQQRAKNDYGQQAVVQELQLRDTNTAHFLQDSGLGKVMDRATEGGFVWFLGSPSYWMVNATQPYMLTLPYLSARYGTGASYAALARARKMVFPTLAGKAARSGLGLKALRRDPKAHREFMRDIFGGLDDLFGGITDPSMRAMLQEVEQLGLIDLTIAKDLNQTIKQTAGDTLVGQSWEAVVDATRVMPHLVEVLNRSMTAVAAYDLASRKGMGHEQATAVAIDAVRKTQFNYSAVNKARFMSRSTSELIRPVMLFQQYAQHVYYLMLRSAIDGFSAAKTPQERKEARKTFYRILGAHTLVAGTLGGMFEPIRAAAGIAFAVAQLAGLADDDDDFESWWQRAANEAFGDTGGQMFSKGIPYGALGADLHGRIGLNNLISMSDPRVKGMEGSEWLMHKMFGMLGALGSTATAMADIPQKMKRGDIYGAVSSASPKALRDIMQAGRYHEQGVLDYTGNVIMRPDQIDGMSLAFKVSGIAPSSVSQMYSSRGAIRRVEARINKKRTRLMERWRRANTTASQQNVLSDIYEFNKNYPEFRIDGKARVQAKARKRENESQAARQGGYYSGSDPRQQRRVQQYGAF